MSSQRRFAVIVAGGSGSRMKSKIPKQFLNLDEKPILIHTIEAFHIADPSIEIILVLPQTHISEWNLICESHKFNTPHKTIAGGKSRFQSVRNGLSSINETEGLVAIHDGVRPFISKKTIEECYQSAYKLGTGVAAVPLKDSIREKTSSGKYLSRNRENYRIIQTPQTFSLEVLKKAFQQDESSLFTDDASVIENAGYSIHLVEGDYNNIKITSPEDLIIGEKILKNLNSE